MESYLPKNIWLISDGKPGHETQLIGLGERIQELSGANLHWHHLKSKQKKKDKQDANGSGPSESPTKYISVGHQSSEQTTCPPDMLIAAGHRTHRTLYFLARKHKAFSTVLMKPSLPFGFFDAVICPAHDGVKSSERVFNTDGVINKIRPSDNSKQAKHNCILLGGPSKHFQWDNASIINQVSNLVSARAQEHWGIYESPRTPKDLALTLREMQSNNVQFNPFHSLPRNALQTALKNSNECWISPDSVSMIYESLTAGCATAIFSLPATQTKKESRVARGVRQLLETQRISQWHMNNISSSLQSNHEKLWEADRAANWLLKRFQKHEHSRSAEQK